MIWLVAFAAAVAAPQIKCPSDKTIELNECLAARLTEDEARMARYLAAARTRLRSDRPMTLTLFDRSQRLWTQAKDAECLAVFDYWSEGTIRTAAQLGCLRRATRERTWHVWRDWLTYMDSTPPILSEPPLPDSTR